MRNSTAIAAEGTKQPVSSIGCSIRMQPFATRRFASAAGRSPLLKRQVRSILVAASLGFASFCVCFRHDHLRRLYFVKLKLYRSMSYLMVVAIVKVERMIALAFGQLVVARNTTRHPSFSSLEGFNGELLAIVDTFGAGQVEAAAG